MPALLTLVPAASSYGKIPSWYLVLTLLSVQSPPSGTHLADKLRTYSSDRFKAALKVKNFPFLPGTSVYSALEALHS